MSNFDSLYTFDSPIPYKGLLFYPIKMKDFYLFSALVSCLMLEKNSISTDPSIAVKLIGMSYLEYLFYASDDENQLKLYLDGLLRLVLGKRDEEEFEIKYVDIGSDGKPVIIIDNKIYNSSDFDEIKKLIAEQNMIELPNTMIQKKIRDEFEEARKFKERLNKSKVASLEEQIIALSLYAGWSISDMGDMTIRKFSLAIHRANHMIMSNIYLTAAMTGFVQFKNKDVLKGWLSDITKEDKYEDVKVDPESLTKKVNFEDANKT